MIRLPHTRTRLRCAEACSDTQAERIRQLAAENRVLRSLLVELTCPCLLDRDGHCIAHGWPRADPPCPHSRVQAALGLADGTEAAS
jgi:hypothetical protein